MNELLLFVTLILLFTCFANKDVITASLILLASSTTHVVNLQNYYINLVLNTFVPNISGLGYLMTAFDFVKHTSVFYTTVLLLVLMVLTVMISLWYNSKNCFILHSRRSHRAYTAMKLIYAMVLLSAGLSIFTAGIEVSTYSTLLVFALSIVLFFKFDVPPIVMMIISVLITAIIY